MKIAIITGASSGMGREAARQLADRFSGLQEVWLIAAGWTGCRSWNGRCRSRRGVSPSI